MAQANQRDCSPGKALELDIEIGFLEGLVGRAPEYVEALRILAEDYTRRGRFEESLEVDQQLARLQPRDPLVQYNLACSYSLTGRMQSAFATLNLAIDHGYRNFQWLDSDPDLATFRATPFYRRLRNRIQAMLVRID